MKRNWDLIRKILLELQDGGTLELDVIRWALEEEFDSPDIIDHFDMLSTGKGEAGFIRIVDEVATITWSGLEFLALIAEDWFWKAIKSHCSQYGTEVLTQSLIEYISPRLRKQMNEARRAQFRHPISVGCGGVGHGC